SNAPATPYLGDQIFNVMDHPALLALTALGALLGLVAIFVFRNRTLQMRLGYLIVVLAILLLITSFLLFTNASAAMTADVQVEDQIGLFLPIGAVVFGLLAGVFIRKDERLVRSMDRLR